MKPRSALVVATVLVVAGCLGPAIPATPTTDASASPENTTVTVVEVVDGDTVDVRLPNGTVDRVRLLGVDTPETRGETDPAEFEGVPDTEAGRACLRTAGTEASDYLHDRLADERVRLVFDELSDRRGYYGRLLAYVWHGGSNVNYRLVADGYARVYDSEFTHRERFETAEGDAQEGGLGVWGCRTPSGTPESNATLAVVEVHADAAGNDHENLADEYVVLANRGTRRSRCAGGPSPTPAAIATCSTSWPSLRGRE
ncbi:thermonuclease family protein [Haloarculaceae archaeon H-GB11]|nr:thermonuclease family protein [Haloarculaceae archaeon H-GB11]